MIQGFPVKYCDIRYFNHRHSLLDKRPALGGKIHRTGFYGKGESWDVQVFVRDNNVDGALKALKKKMQREGMWREMKRHRAYEKPSERRVRKKAEAIRRARKLERKRLQVEGF
jgi:small subunit ribosomal protein S21